MRLESLMLCLCLPWEAEAGLLSAHSPTGWQSPILSGYHISAQLAEPGIMAETHRDVGLALVTRLEAHAHGVEPSIPNPPSLPPCQACPPSMPTLTELFSLRELSQPRGSHPAD